MKNKSRKNLLFKGITVLFTLFLLGIVAVLFISRDEINATDQNIDQLLNKITDTSRIAGLAISVFNSEEVLLQKASGYENLSSLQPYTLESKQFIASVSKTVLGVCILRCQELGYLKLDDDINDHLPFKLVNPIYPEDKITIAQLATHTSSLMYNETVVESVYYSGQFQPQKLESFMKNYFANDSYGDVSFLPSIKPGTQWEYSNIGTALLAYIIEYKTEMYYYEFCEKYVFGPLQVGSVSFDNSNQNNTSYYMTNSTQKLTPTHSNGISMYPVRDLSVDIKQLTSFLQAIMRKDSRLLTKDSYRFIYENQVPRNVKNMETDGHSIGWMIDRNKFGIPASLIGGDGGDSGINTMMWFDRKKDLGYIMISNTGGSEKNRVNFIVLCQSLVSYAFHKKNQESSLLAKLQLRLSDYSDRLVACIS